jgi:methionyl-tRNA formyltransferase
MTISTSHGKLLFFGNERLATGVTTSVPVLRALIEAGYEIAAVVVAQKETGNSRKKRLLEIAEIAEQHTIPVLSPAKLGDFKDELIAYQADAAILIAFGKIVPQTIIDIFPRGIINIHPSLLPKHRGPTPLESVIVNGETETGVSLMRLAAAMDAGPVYAQESVSLQGNETKQQLADKLLNIGKNILLQHLPAILSGDLEPQEQDEDAASYDQLIERDAGNLTSLDFNESAIKIVRKVRAYASWPRLRITIGTTVAIVTKAHAIDGDGLEGTLYLQDDQLGFHTAHGVFIIDSLIPSGKKEMSAQAFLSGYNPAA